MHFLSICISKPGCRGTFKTLMYQQTPTNESRYAGKTDDKARQNQSRRQVQGAQVQLALRTLLQRSMDQYNKSYSAA